MNACACTHRGPCASCADRLIRHGQRIEQFEQGAALLAGLAADPDLPSSLRAVLTATLQRLLEVMQGAPGPVYLSPEEARLLTHTKGGNA